MEKDKLILPITIIVAVLILGGFYYATQVSKQRSIEKQQQLELSEKEVEETERKTKLDECMNLAKSNYSSNWQANCIAKGLMSEKCQEIRQFPASPSISYMVYFPKHPDTDEAKFYKDFEDCGCSLPADLAGSLGDDFDEAQDRCVKLYGD